MPRKTKAEKSQSDLIDIKQSDIKENDINGITDINGPEKKKKRAPRKKKEPVTDGDTSIIEKPKRKPSALLMAWKNSGGKGRLPKLNSPEYLKLKASIQTVA